MSFLDLSVKDFTEVLASKAAVPGGGGASALVGAIGVALGNMVGNLTVGKKKYADVEEEVYALMDECQALREELLKLIDGDAEVFEPLSKAYGIPKDDPNRAEIMEIALTPWRNRLRPCHLRCGLRRSLLQGRTAGSKLQRLHQHQGDDRPRVCREPREGGQRAS